MTDLARRAVWRARARRRKPVLSFGSWDDFPATQPRVIQVCHPDWRGVRTVAYSFRSPVVECSDLERWGEELVSSISIAGVDCVVIQGWPPGAGEFARRLGHSGISVKSLLHSSPAQHDVESGEASAVDEVLGLAESGILSGVGMAKSGVPAAFEAVGYPVAYVPNRVPQMPELAQTNLGPGIHVGVFAEPFWRKNVTTQLLAVGLMDQATAHVLSKPAVGYLDKLTIEEHGELPWSEFVSLQGSVDLNLYVTLSECHPSTPQESYLGGVPCLVSRVSSVFRSDPVLWELTSTDEPDNPESIATATLNLINNREEAVHRAMAWMKSADAEGSARWEEFVRS